MNYEEFRSSPSFSREELLAFAAGRLIEDAPELFASRLPLPPMLMIDRIASIDAGESRGRIVAERDVDPADWFFSCHFVRDPVQPGCLGVDAVWQLIGFFCAWRGGLGAGRALGCEQISFDGQIRPDHHVVRYEVDIRRCTGFAAAGPTLAIANAIVLVDDEPIYTLKGARVGLFPSLAEYHTDVPIGPSWAEARV